MMIPLLAETLVFLGTAILVLALVPVRKLMGCLPESTMRSRWRMLRVLIAMFILGYIGYGVAFRGTHKTLVELIVPGIFFFGACFVLLTATLLLRTTVDVIRFSGLERENVTDPLTGAFNRRHMDRQLEVEIERARRYSFPLSIIFLDIDRFKEINDRHGHKVGDQVLVEVVELFSNDLRGTDVLTRYGGDEFVVIAPHTPLASAAELAQRLILSIETADFVLPDAPDGVFVRSSAGVASLGNGIDTPAAVLEAADAGLYRAKQDGRNRVGSATGLPPVVADRDVAGNPRERRARHF